jgi:photosystem II stability/assembly factor-like uncharacterized protein
MPPFRRPVALIGALVIAPCVVPLSPPAAAQQAEPYAAAQFTGLRWRNIGPNRGGRSLTIAGTAARPLEYWFGAVGGGLWKTVDGGLTWRPVTDGQIRSSSVGAVAAAESNPDVVYLGMGETQLRGNILQGDGVYRTADGGRTWRHVGLAETQAIARIRVHPADADVVYVAALGHPYGPNPERGVFRSRDGGATWQRVLFRNDSTGAADLAIDPSDPRVIYATLWQVYRTPWKLWSGGAGSGLFKSTDGGDTWTELTRNPGMPGGVIGKIGVAVSPADPRRVYAVVEADSGGVFRSDDGGATWRRTNDERKLRQRAFYYTRLTADPTDPDRVYVLNTGLYRSDDGGRTFPTTLRVPHGDNHDLWIAPNDPCRMGNSNDGGGNVSLNCGETWTGQQYPTAQPYHVATTADRPYHVCGAQQDNSTFCLPSSNWRNLAEADPGDWLYAVGGGESGYIAPHPTDPDVFYAGSQGALLTRYNRRTGEIRDVQVYPRFFSGEPASALPERWQWTFPIVFSPRNPRVLYTTSQHLWKTTDEGQSWTRISPDLTRGDPATLGPTGGPITMDMNGPEIYGTIFALAPSPLDSLVLWAGSDDGLVHLTQDGGATWRNVTPPDLPPFTRISILDASPHEVGTVYLAGKRYQLDDRAPYLYRTRDFGRTWTQITAGVRGDDFPHVVRADPKRRGLLYAGTEHGVYVSFDDGDRWQSLSLNLPDVPVVDLVVEDRDLVIATHGRSMWVLPDVEPLRQLTPAVAAAPAHLYQPREGVRNIAAPAFQYTLARRADSVRVEVLDSAGTVIRAFGNSARLEAERDSLERVRRRTDSLIGAGAMEPAADTCVARTFPPPRPPLGAGLNHFSWDGRYPGSTVFDCMIIWSANPAAGPLAPPGRYRVRLTADGTSQEREFRLERDPRMSATDRDLREQFDLLVRIRDKVSEANEAVLRIREVRAGLRARLAERNDGALRRSANRLFPVLQAAEEDLYQVRNRSGQDPLNFPIKLNNRIASLGRSVATGDARPTDAAYRVFEELSADLARVLGRLEAALARELPAINRRLGRLRLEPLSVGRLDRPPLRIP